MAQMKLISAFFFLAIILSQKFQPTEARNLIFKSKKQLQTRTKISMHEYSLKHTPNGSNLPTDCSSVSACGNEAVIISPPPPNPDGTEAQPPPPGGHADDFRPTTPGHSPGIGHADDFRPTTPGNSPGIGHSDDFRPTTPGHSPGIGHS